MRTKPFFTAKNFNFTQPEGKIRNFTSKLYLNQSMKIALFTVFSTLFSLQLLAQAPQKSFTEKLDGIKTSSKELTKNASTDNSSVGQSGVMNTSVPLVTVSSRTMSFPLQLQYSSGITVDQQSGSVGLGWALPIGSIVRDFGAYEPDYSSTYHEADMFNKVDETAGSNAYKGKFATINGTTINPTGNNQYLGYDAIENVDERVMPLSDKYNIQVAGSLSNTFWNNGLINQSHNWKLNEFENWKIEHTVKTYTISQEFSRINEVNLVDQNGTMLLNKSYAAAIGVFPYVNNGYAIVPAAGSESFNPSENERVVRYEDFEKFIVTDDNGTRYVFGRALRGQKFVFSDDPYWSNKSTNGYENSANGSFWKVDYIAEWLLTEIQSVDYVDLNGNGIADDADAGDWMRFEYTDPIKVEDSYLAGQTSEKTDQTVPKYREWSSFSQTDRASSLMRELAYLTRIVTPTQELDFTISERYDVDHDYYTKPANRVGNNYYYEDRKYTSQGSTTDFDIEYPVETMKYDSIRVKSRLIDKRLYPNESNLLGTIVLNYAAKGSAEELAVSSYLIRNNNKLEKLLSNGQLIGKPSRSANFNMEEYYSATEKRGKTTLLGVEFFGSNPHINDKTAYKFEYGYNPSYDEIHKREIVRAYHFPSLRQGSSSAYSPNPLNKGDLPINYQQKILGASGLAYTSTSHVNLSPYDFLIDFPYEEKLYTFNSSNASITAYVVAGAITELYPLTTTPIAHPLKPIKDVFGFLYAANCTIASSAWSMTKITYPTGGQVTFEYEQGSFTPSTEWNIKEHEIPVLAEYNALAKQRSYVQDSRNRYYASTYATSTLSPKKLTSTYEVSLPTSFGVRLKRKTIDDRLNPAVVVNYEFENGRFTALPSAYIQSVVGGFNQFITRENHRHVVENGHYLASGTTGYTYDFQEKMSYLAHTNIALDDYNSIHFYQSIKTKQADNSFTKTIYGPIQGTTIDYPIYNLYCFRLPSADWGNRLTLAGDNVNRLPITVISEESYQAGASTPYQKVDYTYERIPIITKSLTVEYTIGTQNPNTVKLWDNEFEIFVPDIQGSAQTYSFLSILVHNELYLPLPYFTTNSYSYQRWGSFKMVVKKKVTNYKGLISTNEYTYDPISYVLREEKSFVLNQPEIYLTRYEYAHETYNTLTPKFSNLNLFKIPTKTTTYLGSVTATNALSANVMTFDYSYAVPKPLNSYQYETTLVNQTTGVFTLPAFDPTSPNWRPTEANFYTYNRAANPISTRTNQLYNKTVVGNGLNTTKATISGTERPFDATYTGFEDFSKRALNTSWNTSSYLEEEWLTNETATAIVPAKIGTSSDELVCPNSSAFPFSNNTLYHVVSVNSTADLTLGDQVTLSFDYNGNTTQFTTEITTILPASVLLPATQQYSYNYLVCFSTTPSIPSVFPLQGVFTNVTLTKATPFYRLSSAYSRTGKYSYKLPTIRTQGETAKTTPIRPVKIEQQLIATECMVGQNPDEIVAKSTGNAPSSCYWDYQASVWLKYDKDLVMSTPTSEPVITQSDDVSADAIYRRGTVNTTTNQGIKIICKVWNSTRTQVIEEFVFYPQAMNTAWQQFTVDIPIFKGPKQWVDVYVENNLTQSNPSFQTAKSVYVDDIVVYPKEAKYNYAVYDKFGNTTYSINNDDVYTQAIFDAKGRNTATKNAYNRTVVEIEYFEQPDWLTAHNHLTQRQWIANGLYNDTRYYLDGFGKTKQAMVSNNVRNSRMVSETNIFNSKGQVYRAYKPYALNGQALSPKYDGGFVEQTQALYGSNYAYTEVTFQATPDTKISTVSQPRSNSEATIVSSQSDYVNTVVVTHPYLSSNATFATGTLIVNELINELGSKTRTYIDNLGRVIMEEHEIGNTHQQNTDGSITILGTNLGYAQTWFVYDGAGRITATYDPDGKKTEYFYNSLGLVIKSISPDKGKSEMRYDKYGQVRFVKNARDYEAIQTNNYGCDQFKFMKYDKWGRVIESGVLTVAPNSLGGSSSNPPFPTAEFFDDYSKVNDQNFPSSTQPFVQIHAKSVYDGSRMLYASSDSINQTVYSEHGLDNTTYLYSPAKIDQTTYSFMADGQSAKTVYAYDGLAGLHTITLVYNELRQPIGKDYTNSVNNNHNFKWRETLDNLGRVATTSTIHNSITTQTGKNYFDPMGNLVMMGVGSTGVSTDPHIDYQVIKKDIRDQLTSQMSKFFRVGLTYNAAGNITNQYWSNEHFDPATANSSNINQYAYTYDKMNRLIGADYKQSTLTSNPFAYFNAVSGTLPNDFSCYVNEGDVVSFLHPFYAEWEENIDHGDNAEQSAKCLEVINELQANYVSNNVPYAVMSRNQRDQFLADFFTTCDDKKYDIMAFEIYQATKADNQSHIDSIQKDGLTVEKMKYVTLLLIDMPFITNQDCFPNPNATAYGYLPDFVTPTATTNSTKYDAAYWYSENGNMTQLNRNDDGITNPIKTIQTYTYSNSLNNRLTNVVWTVAGNSIDQCNYSYDATGNLLNDSRNGVSSIKYSTYDDMPTTIVNTNGSHEYRYFGGQRSVKEISDIDREYYIDDIVLNQLGSVKSYQTANGYVTPNSTTNGVDHFYNVKDWLGTNRAVLSSNGTVINASDTYPYGKKLPGRNEFNSSYEGYRYQFTGHELDGETGYQYHGARYYSEELGRYMSVDPLADQRYWMSSYNFVQNNPIIRIDPDGRLDTKFVDDEGNTIVETDDKSKDVYVIHDVNKEEFIEDLSSLANNNKDKNADENKKLGQKYGVILDKLITESKYKVYDGDGDFMIGYNCGYDAGLNWSTLGNCGGTLGNSSQSGGGKSSYAVIIGKEHAKSGKMNIFDPKIKNNKAEYIIKEYTVSYYKMGDKITEKRRGPVKK